MANNERGAAAPVARRPGKTLLFGFRDFHEKCPNRCQLCLAVPLALSRQGGGREEVAGGAQAVHRRLQGEQCYPQNHVGRGRGIRNGAAGAIRLPKILVLTSDDFVLMTAVKKPPLS